MGLELSMSGSDDHGLIMWAPTDEEADGAQIPPAAAVTSVMGEGPGPGTNGVREHNGAGQERELKLYGSSSDNRGLIRRVPTDKADGAQIPPAAVLTSIMGK